MSKLPYEVDPSIRINQLKEDNDKEDILIKKLEKKLGLSKRKNKNKPLWMSEANFDDLLDFAFKEEDSEEEHVAPQIIGEAPPAKKTKKNIYAEENISDFEDMNKSHTPIENSIEPSDSEITKTLRKNFNLISDSQMTQVCDDLVNTFTSNSKSQFRRIFISEMLNLLKFTPFSFRDHNLGWFHQDLAVLSACISLCLYKTQQDVQFRYFLIEKLIMEILEKDVLNTENEYFVSLNVYLVYLYRFGIVSSDIILDLAIEFAKRICDTRSNIVRIICQSVGVILRKDNFEKSKTLMDFMKEVIANPSSDVNVKFDFEASIKYLEHKNVKEVWLTRTEHMKKMIKTWTRGYALCKDLTMNVCLDDIKNIETKGRFWLIGSSYAPGQLDVGDENHKNQQNNNNGRISPELLEAAKSLGFITPFRQEIFSILATADKGAEGAVAELFRACGKKNETRERDMISVIIHCLLSEHPYNSFYGQVIGSLLNTHRRFTIMVKCAIWDVIQKSELSSEAKDNCSKFCSDLFLTYDFPLNMIKKFNYADTSEENVIFLRNFLNSTIKDSFTQLLLSTRRLCDEMPKFCKNLRIFIRKHCKSNDELIQHRFAEISNLIQTLLVNK